MGAWIELELMDLVIAGMLGFSSGSGFGFWKNTNKKNHFLNQRWNPFLKNDYSLLPKFFGIMFQVLPKNKKKFFGETSENF